eukprot:TRINITY_DN11672_c0_g2_i1.p1 TRINITY_DN11672_c0_g2~~TRINITY_DN11672_c0_g2_i1.p1  ORF type:complete len:704 (-),score=77.45 TRINITY_DN11672_c0_g2_i1:202-2313(-)
MTLRDRHASVRFVPPQVGGRRSNVATDRISDRLFEVHVGGIRVLISADQAGLAAPASLAEAGDVDSDDLGSLHIKTARLHSPKKRQLVKERALKGRHHAYPTPPQVVLRRANVITDRLSDRDFEVEWKLSASTPLRRPTGKKFLPLSMPPQLLLRRSNVATDRISDRDFETKLCQLAVVLSRLQAKPRLSLQMSPQAARRRAGIVMDLGNLSPLKPAALLADKPMVSWTPPASPAASFSTVPPPPVPAIPRHSPPVPTATRLPRPTLAADSPSDLSVSAAAMGGRFEPATKWRRLEHPLQFSLSAAWCRSSCADDCGDPACGSGSDVHSEIDSKEDLAAGAPALQDEAQNAQNRLGAADKRWTQRHWSSQKLCSDCRPLVPKRWRLRRWCFCPHRSPRSWISLWSAPMKLAAKAHRDVPKRVAAGHPAKVRQQARGKQTPWQCEHGRRRDRCVDCSGCVHGSVPDRCRLCRPCPHGRVARSCSLCSPCEHGKVRDACVECNGCWHQVLRSSCVECSGCEHGRLRSACVKCRPCPHGKLAHNCELCYACPHGKVPTVCRLCAACQHGRRKFDCPECSGRGCSHGRLLRACKDCRPCPHGRRRQHCPEVGCAGCEHAQVRSSCRVCSGCPHGRRRRFCKDCNPCPHGKRKQACKSCSGCPHGKIAYSCGECKGCPHGRVRRFCKLCNGCNHGQLKRFCRVCSAPP